MPSNGCDSSGSRRARSDGKCRERVIPDAVCQASCCGAPLVPVADGLPLYAEFFRTGYFATMMRAMRAIVALVLFSAIAVSPQQIPLFKSGVDVVQFTVTVLDKDRRPVTGLTAVGLRGARRRQAAPAGGVRGGDAAWRHLGRATMAVATRWRQMSRRTSCRRRAASSSSSWTVRRRSGQPMQAARAVAARRDRSPRSVGLLAPSCLTAAGLLKFSQGITADRARLHAAVDLKPSCGVVEEPPPSPTLAAAGPSRGAPSAAPAAESRPAGL